TLTLACEKRHPKPGKIGGGRTRWRRKISEPNRRNDLSGSPTDSSILPSMKIRKLAGIPLLVFATLAANDVAPSSTELEAMYDRAYRAFDSANYVQALKELDAID